MKKSLLVLGAIAALAFVGCRHGSTTTDSDPNVGDDTKATSYAVDFENSTIKDAYVGTYEGTTPVGGDVPTAGTDGYEVFKATDDEGNENDLVKLISVDEGVLLIAGYSWDKYTITLPETADLSSYKTLSITAKVADGFTKPDAVIFEVSSGDEAASGVTTWTDSTFFGDLTTDFKTFTIGMDKFSNLGDNSVYGAVDADFAAIKEININLRSAKGSIYIKEIKFE